MLDLNTLIAGAQATVAAKASLVKAEKKVKEAASASSRTQANAEALAIRTQLEWRPAAVVFRWQDWMCACGCHGENPLGIFILHEHIRSAWGTRLVPLRPGSPLPDLPQYSAAEVTTVPVCRHCASAQGFIRDYTPPRKVVVLPPPSLSAGFVADWNARTAPLQEGEPE